MAKHTVKLSTDIDTSIDAADLPIGGFGVIVGGNNLYKGEIVTRIWCNTNAVYLVSLNNPRHTWPDARGVFRVIPVRPGMKITISVIDDTELGM